MLTYNHKEYLESTEAVVVSPINRFYKDSLGCACPFFRQNHK